MAQTDRPALTITNGLHPLPLMLLFCVGSLMATILLISKLALSEGVPPLASSFWMMLGSGLLLSPAIFLGNRQISLEKLRFAIVAGLISLALPTALIVYAIPKVGAGLAAVTYAFPPLLTYLFSIPLGMEKMKFRRLGGMLLALSGALIIVFPPDQNLFNPWMLVAMGAPVSLACGNLYRTLSWPKNGKPAELAAYMLLGAALLTLPVMLLTGQAYLPGPAKLLADKALFGLMAVTSVMYIFFFLLQKKAGPVYLSQIGYVIVPVGLLLGYLIFDESYSWSVYAALILIFIGLILANKQKSPLPSQVT